MARKLIDQGRALADQTVPGPMKGLDVELVLALQLNKPHGRACRGFRNSLRVAIVVLLHLDVGPDIFGRHQPDVVTTGRK